MITNLGDRMREARARIPVSQETLASTIGVSVITISRIERGVSLPSAVVAAAIARELRVSIDWLLTGEGRGPHSPIVAPAESAQEVSG